jgi:hypothetical protein
LYGYKQQIMLSQQSESQGADGGGQLPSVPCELIKWVVPEDGIAVAGSTNANSFLKSLTFRTKSSGSESGNVL